MPLSASDFFDAPPVCGIRVAGHFASRSRDQSDRSILDLLEARPIA